MSTQRRVAVRKLPSRAFLLNPEATPAYRDGDSDSESDCSDVEEVAVRERDFPMASMGPFVHMPKTNKLKATLVVAFTDFASALNADGCVADVRWQDILKMANDAGLAQKLARFDPQKCVPISLSILGTNLGERESHCAVEVFDSSNPPKPLYSTVGYKHSCDETSHVGGYPLFLLNNGHRTIMHNPPKFTDELSAYWHINLSLLERGVESYRNPHTNERFRLVKRNSRAAAMLDYALSVKNNAVVPRLLSNKAYFLSDDPNLLKIPEKMYTDVYNAYKTKLETINGQSYNLSKLRFKLKPLALSRDYLRSHPLNHAHVMYEIVFHAPEMVDPDEEPALNWPAGMPMGRGAPRSNCSSDEDDDDL